MCEAEEKKYEDGGWMQDERGGTLEKNLFGLIKAGFVAWVASSIGLSIYRACVVPEKLNK